MVDVPRKPRGVAGSQRGDGSYPEGSALVDATIGNNIRSFRTATGMSLGLLARTAGVNEAVLSTFEQGLARPCAEDLLAIATSLRVDISDLFAGL